MARRRIGELLIKAGGITPDQLEEALRHQVVHGGRLGTNLVEMFDLDLDDIAVALGRQHHMPPARRKHFERVDPELQNQLPVELAARWGAVPIGRVSGDGRIAVAVTDPLSPEGLAELHAALGGEVMAAVAAELRIYYYLEHRYGLRRPNRFKRAPTRIPTPPPATDDFTEAAPVTGERRGFIRVVTDSGIEPAPRVLAKIQIVRPTVGLASERRRAADPTAHEEVLRAIRQATGRDVIGELVVDAMREGFDQQLDVGLVLVVRDDLAVAWKGFVREGDPTAVDALAIPLDLPSAVAEAYRQGTAYLGPPLRESLVEQRLAERLGHTAAEVIVVPIELLGRVVCLLYGQSHRPGALVGCADRLGELGKGVGAAFARLVRAAQR